MHRTQEGGVDLGADPPVAHPRAVKEGGGDEAAAGLLGHRDPRLLQNSCLEVAPHEPGEALGGTRHRGAGGDGLARHGAFQHLQPGVGGAVAIVESHQPVGELLRRVDTGCGRDHQRRTHDHAPATDLEGSDCAVRHPAVIAALSPLKHRGFAAILEFPLIGDGLAQGALGR
jgi:hypothetical protein